MKSKGLAFKKENHNKVGNFKKDTKESAHKSKGTFLNDNRVLNEISVPNISESDRTSKTLLESIYYWKDQYIKSNDNSKELFEQLRKSQEELKSMSEIQMKEIKENYNKILISIKSQHQIVL